jgi:DNA ligase D-like protein (predicted 3'-phosphoesterase)
MKNGIVLEPCSATNDPMQTDHQIDMARPMPEDCDVNRDPVRLIRLERDPTVSPTEMSRPSQLLSFGSGVPEQYSLFDEHAKPLRYVVKRHRASKLHTDFRLKAFGHLLSWASYKRPSLQPSRSIQLREMPDHDPRYMKVERRIPDGAYGAGPTVVWDYGTYRPIHPGNVSQEQAVVDALQKGRLDFWLEGVRLKGGFCLELSHRGWQLTKLDDEHATTEPFEWDDYSVLSGKTLDDIEAEYRRRLK